MPIAISSFAATAGYASPFIGPINETLHLKIDLSGLTTKECDSDGYLKPGVPFALSTANLGVLINSEAEAGTAVAAAFAANAVNTGTCGAVTVSAGAKAGVYRVTIIEPGSNVGTFTVEDPDGIQIGQGAVASAFSAGGLAFTIADGATDFIAGEGFTITVTLTAGVAATDRIHGVTIEPTKLPVTTPATNTTLSAETGDCFVAVAVTGTINRDIGEDVLERAYTAAELAAFANSRFTITTT